MLSFPVIKRVQGCSQQRTRIQVTSECINFAQRTPRCAMHSREYSACLFVYFFECFVGLFELITFDPFYKSNNTLILRALAELQHDFGHSQCYANRTRPTPRLVRFASLQMSSMHVALPLMHSEMCIISILHIVHSFIILGIHISKFDISVHSYKSIYQ